MAVRHLHTPPRAAGSPLGVLEGDVYAEWKRSGRHLAEYGSECIGTAFSLFCVVTVVAVMLSSGSPVHGAIPSVHLRLLLTGLLLGGAGWLVALSPPGKLSGAHINPAVSIGMWLLDKMHLRDVLGYVAGQLIGALIGTWLGIVVVGSLAAQVHDAALAPGTGVAAGWALAGEAAATAALTFTIFTFLSHRSLHRWTAAVATLMVGILVWADGSFSGAGMNPARWFGPALWQAHWSLWWVYVAGPVAGVAVAVGIRRLRPAEHARPHTGKIVHDPGYRSIFKHDRLPSSPPAGAGGGQVDAPW